MAVGIVAGLGDMAIDEAAASIRGVAIGISMRLDGMAINEAVT